MDSNQLGSLEKEILILYKGQNSEENRIGLRKTVLKTHDLLRSAKTIREYCKIEQALHTYRLLLKKKYRDYVTLEFIPLPR